MVVLDSEGRADLYRLVSEITTYMRSQLELQMNGEDNAEQAPSSVRSRPPEAALLDQESEVPTSDAANTVEKAEVDASISQKHTTPSHGLVTLRKSALFHLHEWRVEFLKNLKALGILSKDNNQVVEERRKRSEKLAQMKSSVAAEGEDLMSFGDDFTASPAVGEATQAIEALQAIYHPIPTRLADISLEDRKEILSALLILLLSTGNYSAYSRTFITYLVSALKLPLSCLTKEEKEIAKTMIEKSSEAEKAKEIGHMSAEAEAQKRKQQNQAGRFWKVGLASVAGAAIIGVTGGLAAPVVAGAIGGLMGSVGLGGLASFLGIFWMNGALVGTLFGAFGARMTVSRLPLICLLPSVLTILIG